MANEPRSTGKRGTIRRRIFVLACCRRHGDAGATPARQRYPTGPGGGIRRPSGVIDVAQGERRGPDEEQTMAARRSMTKGAACALATLLGGGLAHAQSTQSPGGVALEREGVPELVVRDGSGDTVFSVRPTGRLYLDAVSADGRVLAPGSSLGGIALDPAGSPYPERNFRPFRRAHRHRRRSPARHRLRVRARFQRRGMDGHQRLSCLWRRCPAVFGLARPVQASDVARRADEFALHHLCRAADVH